MTLSTSAIQDLKQTLVKNYGSDFGLSDTDLNDIGMFLLISLAEVLKEKVKNNPL